MHPVGEARMTRTSPQRGQAVVPDDVANLSRAVVSMLAGLEIGGEATATCLSAGLDRLQGAIVLSDQAIADACAWVPQRLTDDIA